MTTRSPDAHGGVAHDVRVAIEPLLLAALGTATLGGALLAAGPLLPVAVADDGTSTGPAFPAVPLLALLAIAPMTVAWVLAGRGRAGPAAGLLVGLAALAPGRAVLDLQLVVAPWRAARPELLVSTSLAPLRPGAGAWALLLGQLLTGMAGVLAARRTTAAWASRRSSYETWDAHAPETPESAERAERPENQPGAASASALTAAMCVGAVIAAGVVAAPFRSTDPYLLPRAAADAPPLVMTGVLLLAAGVVLAACLAAVAADVETGRAALLGIGLGVVAVALPVLLAVALDPALTVSWGPLAALVGAVGLAGVGWLAGRERAAPSPAGGELRLPALDRLHAAAGALAVVAGLAAVLGAALDQVSVPAGTAQPVLYAARLLVPAGLILALLGAVLVAGSRSVRHGSVAALARPALAVVWAAVALAGMAVLDAALTATQISGVRAGAGLWATGVALLGAPAAGCLAAVAGSVERDEVDLSDLHATAPAKVAGALAAALAVPAFGLPLLSAPGYAEAGLWSNFQVASWGQLAAALAVLSAALLAPWSRPSRAAGLALGAAAVLAVHLAQVPLTGGRVEAGAEPAAGTWFGLACLAALLAGALLAWRARRPAPSTLRDGRRR